MTLKKKTAWMRGIVVALLATLSSSCVSLNVPNHGGGKRFFVEQALLTKAADSAISQLDFAGAAKAQGSNGLPVEVYVIAMGDEGGGGGFESDNGFLGLGALGLPFTGGGAASPEPSPSPRSFGGGSHAFANARDIEYVRGRILQGFLAAGVRIAGPADPINSNAPKAYVLISELGTMKEGFDLLVYNEEKLAGRVALEGFLMIKDEGAAGNAAPRYMALGSGECTTEYLARYLFGAGPLLGAQIMVTPGSIPMRVVGPDGNPIHEDQGN